MPNALPIGPGTRVFAGDRAIFSYNGEIIALATGISGSEDIGQEAIEVLGRLPAVEHVPISYRCTLSCSIFRSISRRTDPKTSASPGSLREQNIFPRLSQILIVEGVDVAVYDELSKKAIYFFEQVKAASRNFNIPARGVVLENLTFVTTRMLDEGDPEIQVFTPPILTTP